MKHIIPILFVLLFAAVACTEEEECIDCTDVNGNVFTFCDPPENPLDSSVTCGTVYTR